MNHNPNDDYGAGPEFERDETKKKPKKSKAKTPRKPSESAKARAPENSPHPDSPRAGDDHDADRHGDYIRRFPPRQNLVGSLESDEVRRFAEILKGEPENGEHPDLGAAYTYFGQFVTHDISAFGTPHADRHEHITPKNLRTPYLDLDSLYGGGPNVMPFLYEGGLGPKFIIGGKSDLKFRARRDDCQRSRRAEIDDIPRNQQDVALVADSRNDSTVMIAQMHLAFLKAHNRIVDMVRDEGIDNPVRVFEEAKRRLTRHYQWVVTKDWLPKILNGVCAAELETKIEEVQRRPIDRAQLVPPKIALEVVMGVLRFGHSMVRSRYVLNEKMAEPMPLTVDVANFDWFNAPYRSVAGYYPIRNDWWINWSFFLPISPETREAISVPPDAHFAGRAYQRAHRIGPGLSSHMRNIHPRLMQQPGRMSIAEATISSGRAMRLADGPTVARHLGFKPVGPEDEPLWLYVLNESVREEEGLRLGSVGSRLLLDTFWDVLVNDPDSYLIPANDRFIPSLSRRGKSFDLADLLLLDRLP